MMRIGIAADHCRFELKVQLTAVIKLLNLTIRDYEGNIYNHIGLAIDYH